jgi:cytochrome c biogenesis DsbD-like protein
MLKALAAAIAICALVPLGAETTKETAHLTIKNTASAEAAVPGRKVSLFVDVAPKPKMHVYAPGQPGYIAINLALDPDPAFTAARARYPAAEKLLLKILNERQLVYAKPFRISQELTLGSTPDLRDRAAAGGALTIKGTLRYQACDEAICYLPVNVPVEWTLPLASAR